MWGRLLPVSVVAAACGRVGFDRAPDAAVQLDNVALDVAPLGPFGAPSPISGLPVDAAWPTLTGDLLEVYFDDVPRSGIWRATRPDSTAAWSASTQVVELGSFGDTDPGVSPDGLRLWLVSARTGTSGLNDLWFSTRPDRGSAWSTPVAIAELNSSANEFGPAPLASNTVLVFSSFRAGTDDIYIARRASPAVPWDPAVAIAELNTSSVDAMPFLTADERVLFFSSNRPGGTGGRDLYMTTRASVSEPFGTPVELAELGSTADDDRPWVSSDLRTIVFSSDRTGSHMLYMATR